MKSRLIIVVALFLALIAIVVYENAGKVTTSGKSTGGLGKTVMRSSEPSFTQSADATIPPELRGAHGADALMGEDRIFDEQVLMLWPDLYVKIQQPGARVGTDMMMIPYKNIDDHGAKVSIFRAVTLNGEWPSVGKGREAVAVLAESKVGELRVDGEPIGEYVGSLGNMRFFTIDSRDLNNPDLVTVETRPTWNN